MDTVFLGTKTVNETPQQYTQRILSHSAGKPPIPLLAASAKKLARLIQNVPPTKLRKRPAPDKWSVNEILAHLADVEIAAGFRLRLILGRPALPSPPLTRMPGSPAGTTKSAARASQSNNFVWPAKLISGC